MNNRTIILVCLIILIAGAINWILEQSVSEPEPPKPAANEPDAYMVGARITRFDETGKIDHEIRSTRFTHFPATDVTTLEDPSMDLFAGQKAPWNIAAKNGRLLPASGDRDETVELWQHVVASRESPDGDFVNISTESLSVFPQKRYAETDRPVHIDDTSGRTTAAAMKAWFEPGRYLFYSRGDQKVTTVLLPDAFKPAAPDE